MTGSVHLSRVRWSERRGSCVHLLGPERTACGVVPPSPCRDADDEWQGGLCLNCARAAQAWLDAGGEILVGPERRPFRLTAMVESRLRQRPLRRRRPRRVGYRRGRLSPLAARTSRALARAMG